MRVTPSIANAVVSTSAMTMLPRSHGDRIRTATTARAAAWTNRSFGASDRPLLARLKATQAFEQHQHGERLERENKLAVQRIDTQEDTGDQPSDANDHK